MNTKKISQHVYALHADICHAPLFEGIWSIPSGVTLNSYIVKGKKTALIDLVRDWENAAQTIEAQLKEIGIDFKSIDYLILNHLEPDHTGFLNRFRSINPTAQIISTVKGIDLVRKFFKINENLHTVKTGDTLDLGDGIELRFFETPNVHWPETMMTYEAVSQTLFSCDAFGSYGKTGARIFDDEFTPEEHVFYEKESLRYYATIVASFSTFVKNALAKFAEVPIKTIAPSHGIIWRKNPTHIINCYKKYAGYNTGGVLEESVCVLWGSMYGSTQKAVASVIQGILSEGVSCTALEIPATDVSYVLAEAYKAKGIVLAMPTYEYKMFPPMAYVLNLMSRKHFTGKIALRIGSWGWVGGAKKEYDEAVECLKWTHLESYEWQGIPESSDENILFERGKLLAQAVKNG